MRRLLLILVGFLFLLMGLAGLISGDSWAAILCAIGVVLLVAAFRPRTRKPRAKRATRQRAVRQSAVALDELGSSPPAPPRKTRSHAPLPWQRIAFDPKCPYCSTPLTGRKRPSRRSTFTCPHCNEVITVDPKQYIYDSPFLTEEQAGYAEYVGQLDHWVWTRGSMSDYEEQRAKLRRKFGGEPSIRDIIWGLIQSSKLDTMNRLARERDKMRKMFPGESDMQDVGTFELDELQALEADFKEFEREVKRNRRSK